MFKKVFGNPNHTEPIKHLISIILKEDIKEVSLLPQEIIGDNHQTKKNVVDVLATLSDNRKVLVEANTSFNEVNGDRNLFYLCRIMSQDLKNNEKYFNYHEHILINLNLGGSKIKPIIKYGLNAMYSHIESKYKTYSDKLVIYCVNVSHFTEMCYNKSVKKLDEWEKFIGMLNCNDKTKVDRFTEGDTFMKEIMNEVVEYSQEDIMALAYNQEEHEKKLKEANDYYYHKKRLEEDKAFHAKIKAEEQQLNERMKAKEQQLNKRMKAKEQQLNERIKSKEKQLDKTMKDKEKQLRQKFIQQKELLISKAKKMGLSDEEIWSIMKE